MTFDHAVSVVIPSAFLAVACATIAMLKVWFVVHHRIHFRSIYFMLAGFFILVSVTCAVNVAMPWFPRLADVKTVLLYMLAADASGAALALAVVAREFSGFVTEVNRLRAEEANRSHG